MKINNYFEHLYKSFGLMLTFFRTCYFNEMWNQAYSFEEWFLMIRSRNVCKALQRNGEFLISKMFCYYNKMWMDYSHDFILVVLRFDYIIAGS